LDEKRVKFWRHELKTLDTLYRERMVEWERLIKAYDLDFKDQIRDLQKTEYVKISEFYPLARAIVSTVAMNYPHLLFEVTDDEAHMPGVSLDIEDLFERAAANLFEITRLRPHVHQAIFDALLCGLGWISTDYNPPGADIIPPWTANQQDAEDLVSFRRAPPGYVQVDPLCPPHVLGHARYMREIMWVPLEFLRDTAQNDKRWKLPRELKPSSMEVGEKIGFGEPMYQYQPTDEMKATRDALQNGEFVRIDRIHSRIEHKLIIFADSAPEPIWEGPHPFMKRIFTQRTQQMPKLSQWGAVEWVDEPMADPETGEPIYDLDTKHKDGDPGEPGVGYLVEDGFPFIPVRFDLHPTSYYPKPHFAYVESMQDAIVEAYSREAALAKRLSRQILVNQSEVDGNPKGEEIIRAIQRGEDGEAHIVVSKDNFEVLDFSGPISGSGDFIDRMRLNVDRVTRVNEITQEGSKEVSATASALIGAAVEVNRAWMEAGVSRIYVQACRNAFTVMGDPRYTPESFKMNVAPDGEQRLTRALTSADFLWNYRIRCQAYSMQPLFAEMQKDKALEFYDRAINDPNYDRRKLSKYLGSIFMEGDAEKLMVEEVNEEAERAAQLENDRILSQMKDPGVTPKQDHNAHLKIHATYRQHPAYQQLAQQAQALLPTGQPANPQAMQNLQEMDRLMAGHMQLHQQNMAQEKQAEVGGRRVSRPGPDNLISQVRSSAQETARSAEMGAKEIARK